LPIDLKNNLTKCISSCFKVIRKDIPMLSNLQFYDIEKIEKNLEFIGKSEVDMINFSSISKI